MATGSLQTTPRFFWSKAAQEWTELRPHWFNRPLWAVRLDLRAHGFATCLTKPSRTKAACMAAAEDDMAVV
jgi:hypothetical protein